jgi:mutator family transposase
MAAEGTFLKGLVRRGLRGVKLVISDAHEGLKAAIRRVVGASWQRCRVGLLNYSMSDRAYVRAEIGHVPVPIRRSTRPRRTPCRAGPLSQSGARAVRPRTGPMLRRAV